MSSTPDKLAAASKSGEVSNIKHSYPPIAEMGVVSLALIVVGGVYTASHYPHSFSLLIPTILAGLSWAVFLVALGLLFKMKALAREIFFKVGKWTLLVYSLIAGMLEYVFVYDGTRGSALIVITVMLAMFAIDIPMIIAFTVDHFTSNNN
ncbi:MAG: hypothetical protein M0Z45_06875 [Actinomycetota bacterium]|nr:hypothetical protein [Actinomycetota bacterium]